MVEFAHFIYPKSMTSALNAASVLMITLVIIVNSMLDSILLQSV
ncbi:uncharacterized protein DC041_0009689 [Schistosoma bovis]|uniref:Uncharacterized protein n=1 Tax=Schistosoma bovis TaxID=6184 RepID=A0A430QP81_SCHBO|nr:uncharacterized protein DC041_0009689 [Schistosoma bovis]